jgi:anti-repressor protein
MDQPTQFQFNSNDIRVITKNGEPWFVAKDVCEILDIKNVANTIVGFSNIEKDIDSIDTLGGIQKMLIVSEAGLYRLIFQSRKEEAEAFKTWIFSEVLPTIRKTGAYSKQLSPMELILQMAQASVELEKKVEKQESRIEQLENRVQKRFSDDFENQFVTPTQIGAMFEPTLSAKVVNRLLKEYNLQWKVDEQWIPREQGKKYSTYDYIQLENGKTVPQLLWQRRVKELLA